MIRTVAVGTDGSSTAAEAVKEAAYLARRLDAKLVLLSAFGDSRGAPRGGSGNVELEWAANTSARVNTILERTASDLRGSGLECQVHADEGDPADVLARLAEECGADLLVIGNKGMKRRILGSVPKAVTQKADCSVLVVKTT